MTIYSDQNWSVCGFEKSWFLKGVLEMLWDSTSPEKCGEVKSRAVARHLILSSKCYTLLITMVGWSGTLLRLIVSTYHCKFQYQNCYVDLCPEALCRRSFWLLPKCVPSPRPPGSDKSLCPSRAGRDSLWGVRTPSVRMLMVETVGSHCEMEQNNVTG